MSGVALFGALFWITTDEFIQSEFITPSFTIDAHVQVLPAKNIFVLFLINV